MSEPRSWPPGKLLALDLGLARIGVATCDPLGLAARPLTVIQRRSRRDDFAQLARLVDEQEAVAVVCGLPLNMDGSEGQQARTTRKWAERLAYALRALQGRVTPVIFWDERLSTFAAQEILSHSGKDSVEYIAEYIAEDAAAAAVILQSYLDARRRADERNFGEIRLEMVDATQSARQINEVKSVWLAGRESRLEIGSSYLTS
ncbi:MAG: Holliday junction resolvase RuvX [Caldilineaceae bacterium]|nr:Holliday junction resolvase RuvX [Caldilineaceae bacterium]